MPRTARKPTATPSTGGSGQSAAPVVAARVQPVTVPTGLPYGEAGALADAQRQLPLPGGAGTPPPATPSTATSAGTPDPNRLAAALAAATADTAAPVGLGAPSQRPNEPFHAGLPSGPGPGPSALAFSTPDPLILGATILNQLGDKADPQTAHLRNLVNAMLANQGAV